MIPDILYEDNHIIIVNKPAGVLSQGDSSGRESLLEIIKSYIKHKGDKPGDAFTGLIHRLDKQVSGVMVFAKTSKAAGRLNSEIRSGFFNKYYTAVVGVKLPADEKYHRLQNFLLRKGDITLISGRETKDTQRSELYYTTLFSSERFSVLLIKLVTGRKHQIRAQLAGIGAPVAGDKKYGSTITVSGGICLHSTLLEFKHPTLKEKMTFYSPVPDRFQPFITVDSDLFKETVLKTVSCFSSQAVTSK